MKKNKYIYRCLTIFFLLFSGFGFVFSASVNDDPKVPNTLETTTARLSNSQWATSSSVSGGDNLSFQLHYLSDYGNKAQNVKFFLENLDGKTFSAGHTEPVWGKVTSTSVTDKSGSVNINFNEKVKLNLYNVSWQKWPCQSVGCETPLPQNYENVVNGQGLNIGLVDGDNDNHYAGNIVITFKTVAVSSTPTTITTGNASDISKTCAVLNGNLNLGDSSSEYVKFNYGTSSSSLSYTKNVGTKTSLTNFSSQICGLEAGKTYYFRALTSSGISGNINSFITNKNTVAKSVETRSATNISENCAVLRGKITQDSGENSLVKFRYGKSSSNLNEIISVDNFDYSTSFDKKVCGLSDNTKYYFQAYYGNHEGSILNFKTDKEKFQEVNVSTRGAENITQTCAVLRGKIALNDVPEEYVYFKYGSNSNINERADYGIMDQDGYFKKRVCGLNSNTKYYFKAYSDSDRGSLYDFRTKKETVITQPDESTGVITKDYYAGVHAADLYGQIVGGDERVICYFEYGTSQSLGKATSAKIKNVYSNRNCYDKITGLTPNMRYYYRAVAVDDGQKYIGGIKSFVTKVSNPKPNPRPVSNVTVNENVTITVEEVVSGGNALQLNKWVSLNKDTGYGIETNAGVGQTVYYKVRVKNNSNDDIKNVTVTDHIPYELELSDQRSIDDDTDKYLTWKIGKMKSGEVRDFVTEMVVSNKAVAGEVISSKAEISKDGSIENTNSVDIYVKNSSYGNQGASISGRGGFSLLKVFLWFGVILLILVIGLLISRVLATRR